MYEMAIGVHGQEKTSTDRISDDDKSTPENKTEEMLPRRRGKCR